jgi:hypothetical protein
MCIVQECITEAPRRRGHCRFDRCTAPVLDHSGSLGVGSHAVCACVRGAPAYLQVVLDAGYIEDHLISNVKIVLGATA